MRPGRLFDGAAGGLPTWAEVKAQAATKLGIQLDDADILNIPLIRTDAYGKFIPGANGYAQLVTGLGADGIPNTADDVVVEGNPAANGGLGVATSGALRINHAFLDDIAHNAAPGTVYDTDGNPATPGTSVVQADADSVAGNAIATDYMGRKVAYDDELLDAHFITGDGRGNENIGLTAVHHVFHSEHNRQAAEIQSTLLADALASNDPTFLNQWLITDVTAGAIPDDPAALELGRRTPVPGRALRDRDAVSAPRLRRVRAQGAAEHRRVPDAHRLRRRRSIRRSRRSSRTSSIASATRC